MEQDIEANKEREGGRERSLLISFKSADPQFIKIVI
jgi:hypothetical protein